jgi:hypothetical protein
LPRTSRAGAPSFESLVASVTRDVRPRAVLDEWLDRKLVTSDAQNRVVLAEAAFIPRGEDDRKFYYFGRNLHDHFAAAVANVLSTDPPFVERAVHYDGLSPALARRLADRAREIALEALQTANREAHAALATDSGGDSRWNFGVYVYREDGAPADGAAPDAPSGSPRS